MPVGKVGEKRIRLEPLWVRVDRNRARLGVFVAAFISGSALLLTLALVALPGALLGWGAAEIDLVSRATWFERLPWVVLGSLVLLLAIGGFIAAVQLANAQDWVRNRFKGRSLSEGEAPALVGVVGDMALAAGLGAPPELLILESDSVNALAIGTTRRRPAIGVTRGFLTGLTEEEQRAVIATLTARICAGDILFGTALAALMGPIAAIRGTPSGVGAAVSGCVSGKGDGCSGLDGCSGADGCNGCDGCSGIGDLGDSDAAGGCLAAIGIAVFLAFVAAVTYVAVVAAAWIVTLWGRVLHRTSYEKADAEGMLLLKDPKPMISALRKVVASSTEVADGDPSYDSVFYSPTSGTTRIEPDERRRFRRLCEVLGVDGLAASLEEEPASPAPRA